MVFILLRIFGAVSCLIFCSTFMMIVMHGVDGNDDDYSHGDDVFRVLWCMCFVTLIACITFHIWHKTFLNNWGLPSNREMNELELSQRYTNNNIYTNTNSNKYTNKDSNDKTNTDNYFTNNMATVVKWAFSWFELKNHNLIFRLQATISVKLYKQQNVSKNQYEKCFVKINKQTKGKGRKMNEPYHNFTRTNNNQLTQWQAEGRYRKKWQIPYQGQTRKSFATMKVVVIVMTKIMDIKYFLVGKMCQSIVMMVMVIMM